MAASPAAHLPDWLDTAARANPDKLALAFGSDRWSYAELQRAAAGMVSQLATAPDSPPVRVGILSANCPEFVIAIHAARRAGMSIVPLNWRLTGEELRWQLRDSGITRLLVDQPRQALAESAVAGLPVETLRIDALTAASPQQPAHEPAPPIDLGREAAVLYTSGTSGRPKGARLSYGNLWFSAIGSALLLGHRADDVWLAALPLFHVGGLSIVCRAVIGSLPVVLQHRFEPDGVLSALDDGATLVSVVPAMLQRMLDCRGTLLWPATLRCVLVGGSAAHPGLIGECVARGIPVAPTYGLTESASQATTLLPAEAAVKPDSVGRPLPSIEIRVSAGGRVVPPNTPGEIELRGPTLFLGYVGHDPEDYRVGSGRWFPTGDLGYFDDEGDLYVLDRRDDLIVSGGENVYPAEVERVLLEHPRVRDAAVVGLADVSWGSRPSAAIVWAGDPAAAASELLAHCRQRLAPFKMPDRFVVVDRLPRTASGKLLRRALRERLNRQPRDSS